MTYLNEWNKTRLTSFERDGNPGINRINDCLECGNHIYHELDGGTLKTLRIAEKLRKPVGPKNRKLLKLS